MPYAVDPRRQNSAIIGLFPGQVHLYQLHGIAFADRALVDILPVLRPQKNGSGCAYPTMVFRHLQGLQDLVDPRHSVAVGQVAIGTDLREPPRKDMLTEPPDKLLATEPHLFLLASFPVVLVRK